MKHACTLLTSLLPEKSFAQSEKQLLVNLSLYPDKRLCAAAMFSIFGVCVRVGVLELHIELGGLGCECLVNALEFLCSRKITAP